MQQGGFALFVIIENRLHLFLGSIELGKQGLDACDKAFLLGNRSNRKLYFSCASCR